jgi:hypothetical protein
MEKISPERFERPLPSSPDQPSLPLPPEEIPLGKEEQEGPSLYERIKSSLFSWLSILEPKESQSSATSQNVRSPKIPTYYSTRDIITRAEKILSDLEHSRNDLLQEFGQSAQGFVAQHIDPTLRPARELVRSVSEALLQENLVYETMDTALGVVELWTLINDENRLRNEILSDLEKRTRAAIRRDVDSIVSYQEEALYPLTVTPEEGIIVRHEMEKRLQRIYLELETFFASKPSTNDFSSHFVWRNTLDIKRQRLHALALLVVDSEVCRLISSNPERYGPLTRGLFEHVQESAERLAESEKGIEEDPSFVQVLQFLQEIENEIEELPPGSE